MAARLAQQQKQQIYAEQGVSVTPECVAEVISALQSAGALKGVASQFACAG